MVTEAQVWEALQGVTDPEMPISLVDMGMIYGVKVDGGVVTIDMTFTAIGCPAMDMITADVEQAVQDLPGVRQVQINVVWQPPWTKERISPKGRRILQEFGVGV